MQDTNVLACQLGLPPMENANDVLVDNLRGLLGEGKTYESESALARACGVPQRTLNRILNKETKPGLEKIEEIAKGLGVSVARLLTPGLGDGGGDDIVMLRRLDVKGSAGKGRLVFMESDKGRLAFRRDFLQLEGVKEDNAILIYADGQSMEPTIPDAAVVLIDRGATSLVNNKIYAITINDELLIKRLRKEVGGGVVIVSDNPDKHNYPDIFVPADKEEFLTIHGRAFWMGARL